MKVLLLEHPRVVDPERCNDIANTPLSSCLLSGYAAGLLGSQGHEVQIIEGFLDGMSYQEIETQVKTFKPDLLGVHMVYHWQRDQALFSFLTRMKKEEVVPYITAYGFYPTIAYEEILQICPAVDSIIIGEPEMTFAELAQGLQDRVDPAGIPGLALRNGSGNADLTRRHLVEDLDRLTFPVRTEGMYRIPEVNIQGSRGCYGSCTFCYINPFYGQGSKWRGRSPENIVAEIDAIIADRGIKQFYFTDPNFFGPGPAGQKRAVHLASLLKSRNIQFGIEGRVNDIHDQTIEALAAAGLRHILIGLESGRDESLRRLNKMTTVAQNERAVAILRKHGIEPNIGFIMFEPDASLDDIRENFEFLMRNDLLKNLPVTANLLYHHQIILKGTPAYQNLDRQGRLENRSTSQYEGNTPFIKPEVAQLAEIMRHITNFLFNLMAGIWGGKVREPENPAEKYAEANRLLVQTFERSLNYLQAGKRYDNQEITALVKEAKEKIISILNFAHV